MYDNMVIWKIENLFIYLFLNAVLYLSTYI